MAIENVSSTHDEAVMTDEEDLLATVHEMIELLGGQSGDSTAHELQSMGDKAHADPRPTVPADIDDRDFTGRLEEVVADLEETINGAAGSENSELEEFLEGVVAGFWERPKNVCQERL
jgi:hypothetical protein